MRDTVSPIAEQASDGSAYNPDCLLDTLIELLQIKSDAGLARALRVAAPVISRIRCRRMPVGAAMLIRMHELTGLSIRDLRGLMGDRREKFRFSRAQGKPKD